MGKEKPYKVPQWLIPDWEYGRITEEQWTPKLMTYDTKTQDTINSTTFQFKKAR